MAGIVILGLGIGVNSAIFTVVNAVVLRPLPFAEADRIMRLWRTPPQSTFAGMRTFSLSPANFLDWEAQSESFDAMAIYAEAGARSEARATRKPCAPSGRRRASCRSSVWHPRLAGDTATIALPDAKYSTPQKVNQSFDRALQNVRALPGVESAAWVDSLPLQGGSTEYVAVEGAPPVQDSELPVVVVRLPSPGYFATARIALLAGRDFTPADTVGAAPVIIVSELTARRFWPNEDPIGKRVTLSMMSKEPRQVVGVVREVKIGSLDAAQDDSETAIYAPAAQFGFGGAALVIRTAAAPELLSQAMVGAIRAVDSEQPVLDIQTMDRIVEESLGQRPFAMMLLAGFAALALVLASVGIYSVLAYTVRQRVREIGIRMALGAPPGGVLRMVVVEGLKPTLGGVAVGLVLAAALARVMATLLFNVSQHDPGTFTMVALLVIAVGMVATLIPAYRATRVAPIVTLRAE